MNRSLATPIFAGTGEVAYAWVAVAVMILATTVGACAGEGLKLEKAGTGKAYFTHNGKPLLSFGGLSDFIFYAAEDAYDYKLWADWAAEHGINHIRAYPPLSLKHIEKFTKENGGSLDNILFPYKETTPRSRQFDLTRFDERYWQRFRRQSEYLQSCEQRELIYRPSGAGLGESLCDISLCG
jgi:hypothetical protein